MLQFFSILIYIHEDYLLVIYIHIQIIFIFIFRFNFRYFFYGGYFLLEGTSAFILIYSFPLTGYSTLSP